MPGMVLTSLRLTGPGVADAEVSLAKGLNVIVGASNTGKTYIAQCIDFMLGAQRTPKEIPQAKNYQTAFLGIRDVDSSEDFVLQRSLRGGDFLLKNKRESVVLAAKHNADSSANISQFLLARSGLTGKRIQTDKSGTTRGISFRDIARLVVIDETSIITDRSPIHSANPLSKTAEDSAFRLLITGQDDSSVIAREKPKALKARVTAQSDLLDQMIERVRREVASKSDGATLHEVEFELERVNAIVQEISEILSAERLSAASLEESRKAVWVELRHADSRLGVLTELDSRFGLLQEQYASDLARLRAIAEVSGRLTELPEERCPVCGALKAHHTTGHSEQEPTLERLADACRAEIAKVLALIADLGQTIESNRGELARLVERKRELQSALETAGGLLKRETEPKIRGAIEKLQSVNQRRDELLQVQGLLNQLEELQRIKSELSEPVQLAPAAMLANTTDAGELAKFSNEVEDVLRRWKFPGLNRVSFDEKNQDVIISGQRRSSNGKGVRAITHAAFNVALLFHCLKESNPHPGFLVIDSPLIVYRQPDLLERNFDPNVKDEFYRSLAADSLHCQVIVLENDPPPMDAVEKINLVHFSGSEKGRWGFIP